LQAKPGPVLLPRVRCRVLMGLVVSAALAQHSTVAQGQDGVSPRAPGAGLAEEPDPLAPPFLCLLPDYWPATHDPPQFVRWALTDEAGDWRLAPYRTPSGVNVLRFPDQPLRDPPPDQIGYYHRRATEPLLAVLRALTEEQRELLGKGEIVNITSAREAVVELLAQHDPPSPPPGPFSAPLAAACPLLAAQVHVVPVVALTPPDRSSGICAEIWVQHAREVGFPRALQLNADGGTFWYRRALPGERSVDRSDGWFTTLRSIQGSRDATTLVLPKVLEALRAASGSVRLEDLRGQTLGDVVGALAKASGTSLRADPGSAARVIHALGDAVGWDAVAEAVFASGRLALRAEDDGSYLVFADDGQAFGSSMAVLEAARSTPVPELTQELRQLLAGALSREWLAETPIPLERFGAGLSGATSDLPHAEARWLRGVVERHAPEYDAMPIPPLDRGWMQNVDRLAFRLRIQFHVCVAACVPYCTFSPETKAYVPADPPDEYFERRGASRDRPVFSTRPREWGAY